jgi:hypothetical protein
VSKAEFEGNLLKSGWARTSSKDGKVTIFEKNGARYTTRTSANSTKAPTAEYFKPGSNTIQLKIRMPR